MVHLLTEIPVLSGKIVSENVAFSIFCFDFSLFT